MNILHEIARRTKERIESRKEILPLDALIETTSKGNITHDFPFENALRQSDIAFICEIKQASPSKGVLCENFPYIDIAKEYEAAGAAAISVLTEPYFFKGDNQYLYEIANTVKIPLLRKDFVVDSYMIYEAKSLGASAVLLICALLDSDSLSEYIQIAHSLGISALVETHTADEVRMAICAGARIIGVNNRNLSTFEVDITLSENLRKLVPPDILFVSESGIGSPEDIEKLRAIGTQAVLIGESIMKSTDKKAHIQYLRGDGYGKS